MSFTEVKVDSETTRLLPDNENQGLSFTQKLSNFVSGLGTTYLTTLSILSTVIVVVVLIVVIPKPLAPEQSENSLLKQSYDPDNNTDNSQNDLIVETNLGKVQARTLMSRDGRDYYAFYKLPYAQPPVGRMRFKHPKPAEKWDGILSEPEGPLPCKQLKDSKTNEIAGSEDCLYLNLFTPKFPSKDDNQTLPVLVYIYGGGFVAGTCNTYSPAYLMDEDVIFIAFQHRIGLFGFLNTEDGEIPGNLGFKDQVMVLKWVKENIEAFGGDPNLVTLIGSSSGAISLNSHMISPMSEGLFHRAFGFSGASIVPTILVKNPLKLVQHIGEQLNCSTRTTRRLTRCLRDADADALVLADTLSDEFPSAFATTVEFIEDPNDLSEIFMPDLPYNRLKNGNVIKVPYIMGNVESEQLKSSLDILKNPQLVDALNKNWTEVAPSQFIWKSSSVDPNSVSTKVWDFYFSESGIGNDTWRNLTDLLSDHTYIHPTYVAAKWQSIHSPENIYLYYFTKEVLKSYASSRIEGFPKREYGPNHGDELQFVYQYTDERFPTISKGSVNYDFSKRFIKMIVDFAKTGQPSIPGVKSWDPVDVNSNNVKWLRIDNSIEMTDSPLPRMKFWDQFSPEDLFYA